MDDLEKQFQIIADSDVSNKRKEFINYCKKVVHLVEKDELSIQKASYHICGVSGQNDTNWMLPEDREIIEIACQLELPTRQQDKKIGGWKQLLDKVNR